MVYWDMSFWRKFKSERGHKMDGPKDRWMGRSWERKELARHRRRINDRVEVAVGVSDMLDPEHGWNGYDDDEDGPWGSYPHELETEA